LVNPASDPCWPTSALKDAPDAVVKAHLEFVLSGANILRTNTRRADVRQLRKHLKFKDPALDPFLLIESAAKLARGALSKARGRHCLIAGTIGPWHDCHGRLPDCLTQEETREKLSAWHTDRINRMTVSGVTLFAVESMPGPDEAMAVLDALQKVPGSRCWISFSCKELSLDKLETAFLRLSQHPAFRPKVLAVGVDEISPNNVSDALKELNKANHQSRFKDVVHEKLPYVVCPSLADGGRQPVLEKAREWMALGANIIGGGQGSGPEDIKAISNRVFQEVFDAMEDRAKLWKTMVHMTGIRFKTD